MKAPSDRFSHERQLPNAHTTDGDERNGISNTTRMGTGRILSWRPEEGVNVVIFDKNGNRTTNTCPSYSSPSRRSRKIPQGGGFPYGTLR